MLIDINANIGHWPFHQVKYNTCKALLERMDKFGVDLSVVSNMNGIFYKNTQSSNEELIEEINSDKRFKKRFIPFAVINPIYAGWRDDFEKCIKKFGMKGIRLYPKYHDYEITDPSLIELAKRARDYNIPVAFTIRMIDSRSRSWMDIPYITGPAALKKEWTLKDIVPIIEAVPDAKYLILNVANNIILNDQKDKDLFAKAEVLFDTSGRQLNNLNQLLSIYGKHKFAFGTHSPILDYLTGLLRIEALRESEADGKTKDLLRSVNAIRVIGI